MKMVTKTKTRPNYITLNAITKFFVCYFQDGESGWSSLHRALHFGHLAVAGILLKNDASVAIEDSKSRTPVDLLSGPVLRANGNGDVSGTLTSMPCNLHRYNGLNILLYLFSSDGVVQLGKWC